MAPPASADKANRGNPGGRLCVALMPGESGYGIQQYEDGGNRRGALSGRPAAIKQDGSDEDAATYSCKSRNETDARARE